MLLPALLLSLAAAPPQPQYVLKTKDTRRVSGVVSFDISYPNLKATEWAVFIAVAPEFPGQTDVRTTMNLPATEASDRSPLQRSILLARVPVRTPAQKTAISVRATYEATLRSRSLEPLGADDKPPVVADLTAHERQQWLASRGDIDFKKPAFTEWLKSQNLLRQSGESDLDAARRIFLALRSRFTYEFREDDDRHASAVCKTGKSDCGGLSVLYVAALRANGIPARTLFGRWAKSTESGEKVGGVDFHQWHVKAEFFLAGVGWVPVDLASGIVHDKSAEGLAHFGRDRGDFIVFHMDSDLAVDTGIAGTKSVQNLQRPAHWCRGGGSLDPARLTEFWQVQTVRRP